MDSARGRSFLEEYARRSRVAETATLLTAIGRIENLLTSRTLEPAEPAGADSVPASETADGDALDIDVLAAEIVEIVEIESDPASEPAAVEQLECVVTTLETFPLEASELEALSVEPAPIDDAALETAEILAVPLDVVAAQADASELLGPELHRSEPARPEVAPDAERRMRERGDPFADIRALSDEEKIALFT